jgi:hypothetical protein
MNEPLSKRISIDTNDTLDGSMKSLNEHLVIITTKTYDGGYRRSYRPSEDNYDAFMHYSDRNTRIKALFISPAGSDEETPSSPTSSRKDIPRHRRQTRISFEVHPSILVTDADLFICDDLTAARS